MNELMIATFAAGCFWGVEAHFSELPGVVETRVGFTGGTEPAPTYRKVCGGGTGHAEAVEVRFDPAKTSYDKLLDAFFALHGTERASPAGYQYRSAIFYHDAGQKSAALAAIARRKASTRLEPAGAFFAAEDYHQKYYAKAGRKSCNLP